MRFTVECDYIKITSYKRIREQKAANKNKRNFFQNINNYEKKCVSYLFDLNFTF